MALWHLVVFQVGGGVAMDGVLQALRLFRIQAQCLIKWI